MAVNVLFVCLGNICRSPTAHGVFERYVQRDGLEDKIRVDSAGTGSWHIGEPPDSRASAAASKRGFSMEHLRARQVRPEDFLRFDYILPMDFDNMADLEGMRPATFNGELRLFLDFAEGVTELEVPDPYYGGVDGFDFVLDLVEAASESLLEHIRRTHL